MYNCNAHKHKSADHHDNYHRGIEIGLGDLLTTSEVVKQFLLLQLGLLFRLCTGDCELFFSITIMSWGMRKC